MSLESSKNNWLKNCVDKNVIVEITIQFVCSIKNKVCAPIIVNKLKLSIIIIIEYKCFYWILLEIEREYQATL